MALQPILHLKCFPLAKGIAVYRKTVLEIVGMNTFAPSVPVFLL
jgi:hypothetical protein